jgi:monoamine oxidase
VLEGRARVGGRTSTVTTSDQHWIDVGGAYVGPGQRRILRLARELGVKTEPVYTRGRSVMMVRGERTVCESSLPRVGPRSLMDVNAALTATEEVRKEVDLIKPWDEDKAGQSLDSMTMEDWLQSACATEDGREAYRALVRDLLCVEAADVSALFWMWYLHSGQGVDIITGLQGGAQPVSSCETERPISFGF